MDAGLFTQGGQHQATWLKPRSAELSLRNKACSAVAQADGADVARGNDARGSTLGFEVFKPGGEWIRVVKAHPWLAGLILALSLPADESRPIGFETASVSTLRFAVVCASQNSSSNFCEHEII